MEPELKRYKTSPSLTLDVVTSELIETIQRGIKESGLTCEFRIAGGWVRDKLLGHDSTDIDFAISCTDVAGPAEFARRLAEVLGEKAGGIGEIVGNAEKGKLVTSATMKVCGLWVDFTMLRSMSANTQGTFADDANMRDFTINSLFYDPVNGLVEDWTGHGLEDLQSGIIRTPLEPLETLSNDYGRVIRAVRFACVYGFQLNPELTEAIITSSSIRGGLTRVSRERFGSELMKMLLSSRNQTKCFKLICDLKLFDILFLSCTQLESSPEMLNHCCISQSQLVSEDSMLHLAAFLLPLRQNICKVKGKFRPISYTVLKSGLMLSNKQAEYVGLLHELVCQFESVLVSTDFDSHRLDIGLILRKCKSYYFDIVQLLSCLSIDATDLTTWIADNGLSDISGWNPMLSGNDIMSLFNVSGSRIKTLLDKSWDLRIMEPSISKDSLVSKIREEIAELK